MSLAMDLSDSPVVSSPSPASSGADPITQFYAADWSLVQLAGLPPHDTRQLETIRELVKDNGVAACAAGEYSDSPGIFWMAFADHASADFACQIMHYCLLGGTDASSVKCALLGPVARALREEDLLEFCRTVGTSRPRLVRSTSQPSLSPTTSTPSPILAPLVDQTSFKSSLDAVNQQLNSLTLDLSDVRKRDVGAARQNDLSAVSSAVAGFENKLKDSTTRISRLERHEKVLQDSLTEVCHSIQNAGAAIKAAKEDSSGIKTTMGGLETTIGELKKTLEELKTSVADLKTEYAFTKQQLVEVKNNQHDLRNARDSGRSFSPPHKRPKTLSSFNVLEGNPAPNTLARITGSNTMFALIKLIVPHDQALEHQEVQTLPTLARPNTTLLGDVREGVTDVAVASAVESITGGSSKYLKVIHVSPVNRGNPSNRYILDLEFWHEDEKRIWQRDYGVDAVNRLVQHSKANADQWARGQ